MSWTRLSSVAVLASCSLVAAGCSLESSDGSTVLLESEDQLHDPSEADSLDSYEVVPAPCLLPKTGQTVSYAARDDGALQQGVSWPAERFTLSGEAVTDALTGLMWTRDANLFVTARTWADALAAIQLLNQAEDGIRDWSVTGVQTCALPI